MTHLSKEVQEHQQGIIEALDNSIKFLDFEVELLRAETDWNSIGKRYCTLQLLTYVRQAKLKFIQEVKGD